MRVELEKIKFFEDFKTNCKKTQVKNFKKSSTITNYVEKRNQICILLKGEADLIRYDLNGNKTIIRHLTENSMFGEVFSSPNTNNELFVSAKTDCSVLFFDYDNIFQKCKQNCPFHNTLIQNFYLLIVDEMVTLNTRVELLTKKNIREKLLSYFELLSSKKLSKTFILPFSLTDLADYLSVDRSAMTRELSHLIEEGFIEKKGKKITLLYE